MGQLRNILVVVAAALMASTVVAGEVDKPLTNAEVVALVEASLDSDLIVAKIQQAPIVELDVSSEELIRLSKKNVPKTVINAMIQRMNKNASGRSSVAGIPPQVALAMSQYASPAQRVELVVGEETFELSKRNGEVSTAGFMMWGTVWLNIPEARSAVRTSEKSPHVRVFRQSAKDLAVVRLEQNRKDRSLQLPALLDGRSVHTVGQPPHPESVVTSEFVEVSPGVWDAALGKPLKKGEYAVFENGLYMYDFGVD